MKRIILALIAALTLCSLAGAKNRSITETDSLGNKKRVIEIRDTVINGKSVIDTLSVMTYESSASKDAEDEKDWKHYNNDSMFGINLGNSQSAETVIAVIAIIFAFGFPLIIVFTVFFFNYKNRKAKYRLAEQALSTGQQLPEDFFKKAERSEDTRSKGIKNIFLGIGLFIFLWAMTNFSIGCIGLLIMFMGFGQVVIYYTQESKREQPFDSTKNNTKRQNNQIHNNNIEANNQERTEKEGDTEQ